MVKMTPKALLLLENARAGTNESPTEFEVVKMKDKTYQKWLTTFTKRAVAIILIVSLVDLQLSYVLAFLGREEIAESLSSEIATTVIGVMLGYFVKALFETFFEKREERLNKLIDQCENEEE